MKDDENQIIVCHRLDKTDRTIVKFLSCKDAEAVFKKKKKKKDVSSSKFLSKDITSSPRSITMKNDNEWGRKESHTRKKKIFTS